LVAAGFSLRLGVFAPWRENYSHAKTQRRKDKELNDLACFEIKPKETRLKKKWHEYFA
jgi:hypothetical protein